LKSQPDFNGQVLQACKKPQWRMAARSAVNFLTRLSSPALALAESEGYLVFRKPADMALIHDHLSRWLLS
jgi:hypothetical protein